MNMNDQGIIRRASFGSKNREHGIWVEGIGAKAVDRFRREGHQLAGAEKIRRQRKGFLI